MLRLAMVIGFTALLVATLSAQAAGVEPLGTIIASRGEVSIALASPPPGRMPPPGQVLQVRTGERESVFEGDVVRTGLGATAKLMLRDESLITLGEESELEVTEALFEPAAGRRSTTVRLLHGAVRVVIQPIDSAHPDSRFTLETPTAVAGVRGSEGGFKVTECRDKKDERCKTLFCSRLDKWEIRSIEPKLRKKKVVTVPQEYCTEVCRNKPPEDPWPMTDEWKLFPRLTEVAFTGGGDIPKVTSPAPGPPWVDPFNEQPIDPLRTLVDRQSPLGQLGGCVGPSCEPPPPPPPPRECKVCPGTTGKCFVVPCRD